MAICTFWRNLSGLLLYIKFLDMSAKIQTWLSASRMNQITKYIIQTDVLHSKIYKLMYIGLRSGSLNNLHTENLPYLTKNAELLATLITNEKELTTVIYKVFYFWFKYIHVGSQNVHLSERDLFSYITSLCSTEIRKILRSKN